MPRRSSRAPLIAGMDMFVCFAAVLFVILGQPQAQIDQQIARKEEQIALLDDVVEKRREERRAVETQTAQARDQAQARIAELESKIASTRQQLERRKQEFASWDVVVDQFRRYSDVSYEPDYHFYLRPGGIYSALRPSDAWTRASLKSWMEQIVSERDSKPYIVFYMENGANDQLRVIRGVVDEINRPTNRVTTSIITLPSGVVAGEGYHLKGDPQ